MIAENGKSLHLSIGRRVLSKWDDPLLMVLTRLVNGAVSISGNFPDYDTLSSIGDASDSIPTVELLSSGKWLLDFYNKSLPEIEPDLTIALSLIESYLSSVYPSLSEVISRQLYQLASYCHTLFHIEGKNSENETKAAQSQSSCELNVTDLANRFNLALREVLLRIHLGALLIGELKWQSNILLFSDLVKDGKEGELAHYITSPGVEADLKKRLVTSLEVVWKEEFFYDGIEGQVGTHSDLLKEKIISFFCDRIVNNTKKGQCEFIKLHVY